MTSPNIILIIVDSLRADSCYHSGHRLISMLQRGGVTFTQAISATSTTTPSVASILTGLYPPSHGVRSLAGYTLNNNVRTLAEILSENGYSTYAEVTGPLYKDVGLDAGFNIYSYRDKNMGITSKWVDRFERRLLDYIEPWFLLLHLWELHDIKRDYNKTLWEVSSFIQGVLLGTVNPENMLVILTSDHGQRLPDFKLKTRIRVWHVLRRLGLKPKDDMLLRTGHGFHVYEDLIRVPLIISGCGMPKKELVSQQVSHVDIAPTIMDALGLKAELRNTDGRSLVPCMTTECPEVPVFSEACGSALHDIKQWRVAVRTARYKFIYSPYNAYIKRELYNLEADPHEKKNIAKELTEVADQLRELIATHYKYSEALGLTREDQAKITERLKRLGYM